MLNQKVINDLRVTQNHPWCYADYQFQQPNTLCGDSKYTFDSMVWRLPNSLSAVFEFYYLPLYLTRVSKSQASGIIKDTSPGTVETYSQQNILQKLFY